MSASSVVRVSLSLVIAGIFAVGASACSVNMLGQQSLEPSALPEPTVPGVAGSQQAGDGLADSALVHAVGHNFPVGNIRISTPVPGWVCGAEDGSDYGCTSDSGQSFTFADTRGTWSFGPGFAGLPPSDDEYATVPELRVGDYVSFPGGACAATEENALTCASLEYAAGFTLREDGPEELNDDEVAAFFGVTPTIPTRYVTVNLDGEDVTCALHQDRNVTFGCQGIDVDWGIDPVTDSPANNVAINTRTDSDMFVMSANMGQDMEGTTDLEPGVYNWMNSADVEYDGSKIRVNYNGVQIEVGRNGYDSVANNLEGAAVDLHEQTLNVDGTERKYLVSAPEGWKDTRFPVIYVVHGKGSNPQRIADATEFHKFADAIVVYPEGVSESWAPAHYAADPTGVADLAFMDQLHAQISQDFTVDQQRVYATGFSNGGGFTRYLSCQRPSRFSTITTAGAAIYESVIDGCAEASVDYLSFHGRSDDLVDFDGDTREENGRSYRYLSATDTVLDAAEDSRCRQTESGPELEESHVDGYPTTVGSVEFNGHCGADIQLITMEDLKHRWPRGEDTAGGVDATIESLNFFGVRHSADRDKPDIIE